MSRTAEEWGRIAVSLPGWRWMPGMQTGPRREDGEPDAPICLDPWRIRNDGVPGPYAADPAWEAWPDCDDPATEGCLIRLHADAPGWHWVEVDREQYGYRLCSWMGRGHEVERGPLASNPARACIAAAEALGRWPGGEG